MQNRRFKLVISLFVAGSDWLANLFLRMAGQRRRGSCVVLAYHAVTPAQRTLFARQMDTLVQHGEPVRADIRSLPEDGKRRAAITFDDGLQTFVDNALPELEKRRLPVALFIVTEALGGMSSWAHNESGHDSEETIMSEASLRQLPSDLVLIGSHTMTHPMLPSLNEEELRRELVGSRAKLETMLNREVTLASFPYGSCNERTLEMCREARYERVFTALPVLAVSEPGEFVTGRVRTDPTDWPIEFRLKLAGAYRWLPYAFTLKRKVRAALRTGSARKIDAGAGEKRAA